MPTLVSSTNGLTCSTSPKRGVPIPLIKNSSMGAPLRAWNRRPRFEHESDPLAAWGLSPEHFGDLPTVHDRLLSLLVHSQPRRGPHATNKPRENPNDAHMAKMLATSPSCQPYSVRKAKASASGGKSVAAMSQPTGISGNPCG